MPDMLFEFQSTLSFALLDFKFLEGLEFFTWEKEALEYLKSIGGISPVDLVISTPDASILFLHNEF